MKAKCNVGKKANLQISGYETMTGFLASAG